MKKWSILILLCIVVVIIGYRYVYQDHRDIATETSTYKLTASDISNEFAINPMSSENKYLNKTIEVSGSISDKNPQSITIEDKVFCQFSSEIQTSLNTDQVKIKGRFIGYDDLLEQVKLDQCIIID
ncbi:hypothetical protein CJ739_359 [Mariniflexile rhizosphaerae]|uniref:OB-fold protein n=1 Tax=unclassified Mariniflexile TaxID=2643887 RepID=UPI000CAFA47E|nr:ATPase/DNA packaging protein [Mariniflexile sp. TRM1-10]AXP79457.1 hypothetical protein CJ739_359 [Mariniflexile sp. TRM1-10]PLB19411.1 MAG: tRNA_anti-like domain containing protein [Flavobacteriaceae bacterium FS1-H7996/R]